MLILFKRLKRLVWKFFDDSDKDIKVVLLFVVEIDSKVEIRKKRIVYFMDKLSLSKDSKENGMI